LPNRETREETRRWNEREFAPDSVGEKACGLVSVLPEWSLPSISITAEAFAKWDSSSGVMTDLLPSLEIVLRDLRRFADVTARLSVAGLPSSPIEL
jgi:hypothetical protein